MKLEDLDGVGPKRAQRLRDAKIDSVEVLAAVEPEDLARNTGISESVAQDLIIAARNSAQAEASIPTWQILLLIAAIGVVLVVGVQMLSTPDEYTYNGFTFTETQCSAQTQCWSTLVNLNIGVREITFYYRPDQVEDVLVEPRAVLRVLNLTRSRNSSLTITFDEGAPGEVGIAASNLAQITGEKVYNISTSGAVYGEVTCEDATRMHAVVYFTDTEVPGVRVVDGCVVVGASEPDELLRVTEAYRLRLLRILQ